MSVLPGERVETNGDVAEDGDGEDPFGRLRMKQRNRCCATM
jgi:hypothetical protein